MSTSCSPPIPGNWSTIHCTAASLTCPTLSVLVRKMGVSTKPHSMSCVMPLTSPAPFSTNPPPMSRCSKTFCSLGRMAVTPVRTGPFPRRSGPAPRMMVE